MIQWSLPKKRIQWGYVLLICVLAAVLLWIFTPQGYAKAAAIRGARLSNLKQLALGALAYEADHGVLPDMKTPQVFRASVEPYVKKQFLDSNSPAPFADFVSKKPLIPNPQLSGVSTKTIKKPEATILIYFPVQDDNGNRAIVFADGHPKSVLEDEFIRDLTTAEYPKARSKGH